MQSPIKLSSLFYQRTRDKNYFLLYIIYPVFQQDSAAKVLFSYVHLMNKYFSEFVVPVLLLVVVKLCKFTL